MENKKWIPWLIGCGVLVVLSGFAVAAILAIGVFGFLMPARISRTTPVVITVEIPAQEKVDVATSTPKPADTNTPAPTETETPTPLPTSTPVPTIVEKAANTVYQNVHFYLDPAIASGINGTAHPAATPSQDAPPWDVGPAYLQIDLNDYVLKNTFHHPSIFVWPADEYAQMNQAAAEEINSLRQMLKDRPLQVEHAPFLPVWNAGQVFHARMQYIEGTHATGVRYLAEYAQSFTNINNEMLFYTFQGFSKDGKYYISMILPVSHPNLPATADMSSQQYEDMSKDYQGFLKKSIADLEALPSNEFKPALDLLDQLVMSLVIE